MLNTELAELLLNGESSLIEFASDDVHADSVATEIAALANLAGGRILLGIDDDGTVGGLDRPAKVAEEWVMNVCRNNVQPPLIPVWETIRCDDDKLVGIVEIPRDAPDKPYKAKRGTAWVTFVRVGTTSREATREEEARLYQVSDMVRYELRPVRLASLADLDWRRLHQYYAEIRGQEIPDPTDDAAWERLLLNTELMVEQDGRPVPTVAGMLLFGNDPHRFLPQAGVTAIAYPGTEKDYATIERAVLRGALVPYTGRGGVLVESGLLDQVMHFVHRTTRMTSTLDLAVRVDRRDYPDDAVREAIVNALIHRDYSIAGTDIELSIYEDRLEVVSPGRLPNTITVERMKAGCRYARNELLKDTMRDYRYVEASGLGVPRKMLRSMRAHGSPEPELIEEETRFIVRLRKAADLAATPDRSA